MANRRRGEIEAVLDGRRYTLCLTLGALARLEAAYGDGDLMALVKRFESGRIGAADAIRILAAGLHGGGVELSEDEVARLRAEGGVAGMIAIVADLLRATFGGEP
jgi:hypothetical protein